MPEQMTPEELVALRKMAAAGNVELQYKLGVFFRAHPELGETGEFARWLGMAAQNGSGDACWELAFICLEGEIIPQDFAKAHALLTIGANLNHPACIYNLGVMYLQGSGVPADPVKAFECFKRGAELGEPNAMYNLALCYGKGLGTARDLAAALPWAERNAASGDERGAPLAAGIRRELGEPEKITVNLTSKEAGELMRGLMNQQVESLMRERQEMARDAAANPPPPKPEPTPRERLTDRAEKGETAAQVELAGELKKEGNLQGAASWLTKAAEAGDPEAQYLLCGCYVKGEGVTADRFKARDLADRASRQGHERARRFLATIDEEIAKALAAAEPVRRAAEAGDRDAQYDFAMLCARGDFAPPDFATVARYLEMAAKRNHAGAQFALYQLYEQGRGVAKDHAKAVDWLARAAYQGHGDAMYFFARRYADGRITAADLSLAPRIFERCRQLYPEYRDPAVPAPTVKDLQAGAARGDLASVVLLAMAYLAGEGVEKSPSEGARLLKLAADAGYAPGQRQLAKCYATAMGVPLDMEAAKSLTIKAAKQGHLESRFELQLFGLKPEDLAKIP
jgi:uncharacterized protein